MAMTGVSTIWADKNYTQTYFGVTPTGAAASGLPVYTAKSGLENIELSSGLFYRASERWSMIGFFNYQRLLDSAADSPIVRQVGSANQFRLGFAILRTF
jgi:outer membrane scaffolding protein for murein synthesis (MipA/OmpV family)